MNNFIANLETFWRQTPSSVLQGSGSPEGTLLAQSLCLGGLITFRECMCLRVSVFPCFRVSVFAHACDGVKAGDECGDGAFVSVRRAV